MKGTCPGCGLNGDIEVFLHDTAWRAALVPALALPAELSASLLPYLRLLGTAKRGLTAPRAGKLLAELEAGIKSARVKRHGVERVAPLALWKEALDEVLAARDAGTLELPLKGHAYLYQVVYALAGKAAGRDERSRETRAQGVTPIGISNAHKPFDPPPAEPKPVHNPQAAARALADMKTTLKGAQQ